mgnify:FL=1
MDDVFQKSLELHRERRGKLAIASRVGLETRDDLSLAYSPGVAAPCEAIAAEPHQARALTVKGNSVAVVTDGSAVLGLGDIGPEAALPVMEGKALLFKRFADIDAWPICLDTQDEDEIVDTVRRIAPGFGGINLEDIAAPRCFAIEARLQDLGIPVFHDDQHGTAIVLLAALLNAARVTDRRIEDLTVVVNGAGAAGTAIAKLLRCVGFDSDRCVSVRDVIVCDSRGAISRHRDGLAPDKRALLKYTNCSNRSGTLGEVLQGAEVFVGVSVAGALQASMVAGMAEHPLVFPMANPVPEIMPEEAFQAGAAVVGTGRSDYPNQVNNVLAFPGIFRGALDAGATRISPHMMIAAAHALAESVPEPTVGRVLPDPLDPEVPGIVAAAMAAAAHEEASGASRPVGV